MASKSKCMVLDVSNDDPSTTRGCTSVLLDLLRYSAPASPCGEVRRKKVVIGDQALVALSRKCISSRSDEKAPGNIQKALRPWPTALRDWQHLAPDRAAASKDWV